MTELLDAPARLRIATDLDETLFVEAAAGTGKTTSLVARLVNLIAVGGVPIRQIAAITFTEKAAGELRARLREALEGAATERQGIEAERCRTARDEFDDATVCTLHAFAQRVLVEFPLEVGLPPQFEVLDDLLAQARFDTAWDRFAGRLLDGIDADVPIRDALALGLRTDDLRALALALHQHWDRVEDLEFAEHDPPPAEGGGVLGPLDRAVTALDRCADPDDLLARHLEDLRPWRDLLAGAEPGPDTLDALARIPKITFGKGRQGNWGGRDGIASVRDDLAGAESARAQLLDATRAALLVRLASRVRRFVLDEAERRRASGRLEFHDLLVLARRLLRTSPEARGALRQRWTRLLVDEFQDTDPLQIELAVLLSADDDDVSGRHWAELSVEPGRLFMVGDPKQSIYRFRRADIALYHEVRERFSGGLEGLVTNFRCAAPVVSWVNHTLAHLMGPDASSLQAAYHDLTHHRPADAPSVQALGDELSIPMPEVRRAEADGIAARIEQAKSAGWVVHDDDGHARAARYADVAVLLPTRTLLPELEAALGRRDIPYRIESRSLLWGTQEVRDLLAVLRSVDDPSDEISLVAALRSPALACADDALLAFRAAGGTWTYLAPQPEGAQGSVTQALDALRALHDQRHWLPVHAMVEAVTRRLGMLQLQCAHRRPRDHWRRLRFVADQARAFEAAGGATLRAFVAWADSQADADVAVNEAIVAEQDDDAVRIMTVHAAKGLEFPVVVLAGINSTPQDRRPPVLFTDASAELSLGTKAATFATLGYEDALAAERDAERAEGVRLLYVATTRARDHLVISLFRKDGGRATPAHALADAGAGRDDLWVEPVPGPAPGAPSSPEPPAPPGPEWVTDRAARFETAAASPVVAATALGAEPADGAPDVTPVWRRGRAGTSIGRAVHATLQSIDLATGDGLEAVAEAQAAAEGVADRAAEVTRLARAALEAATVRRAAAGDRYWREVALVVPFEGTLFEGYVDLLFEDADGSLTVVDYKTDRLDGSDAELPDRYRTQGAAYAAALEQALGRPVGRCVFVFVGSGAARELEVDDLGASVRAVRDRIAGAGS